MDSSENSTTLLGMPTHLDQSPSLLWTLSHADRSLLLSRVNSPLMSPFVHCLPWVPFSDSSDWRSLLTSGHIKISGPNPLSGFVPKQTKGSSAWQTTYIVLHGCTTRTLTKGIEKKARLALYKNNECLQQILQNSSCLVTYLTSHKLTSKTNKTCWELLVN